MGLFLAHNDPVVGVPTEVVMYERQGLELLEEKSNGYVKCRGRNGRSH